MNGRVLPTSNSDLHLAARLVDGAWVVGQHRLTGKEHPRLASAIEELCFVEELDPASPAVAPPPASPAAIRCIGEADLICYPIGSFYSSLLCNVLPSGIGRAIARARCPKVYVPSTGEDPELVGVDAGTAASLLVDALRRDAGVESPVADLLDAVVLDADLKNYQPPPDLARLDALGVRRISAELISERNPRRPKVDPERLTHTLLTLCDNSQEERHP